MAELSTLARPYAEAAFRLGTELGKVRDWHALLSEMAVVANAAEMRALVQDPNVAPDRLYGVFAGVLKTALPQEGQNFLRLLIENDRVAALPEIAQQFTALKNRQEGSAEAEIVSAYPMTEAQVAELVANLNRKFGGLKLNSRVVVDPALIGGVKVTVGDEVFDSSIRAQLMRMRVSLSA